MTILPGLIDCRRTWRARRDLAALGIDEPRARGLRTARFCTRLPPDTQSRA
jgi:hypothetical protein